MINIIEIDKGRKEVYVRSNAKTGAGFFGFDDVSECFTKVINNLSPKLNKLIINLVDFEENFEVFDEQNKTMILSEKCLTNILTCIDSVRKYNVVMCHYNMINNLIIKRRE